MISIHDLRFRYPRGEFRMHIPELTIEDGLSEGEEIVTEGTHKVRDGSGVQPVTPAQANVKTNTG